MSIDHTQSDSLPLLWSRILRPSHRTLPEQLVGLGIYLLLCLGVQFFSGRAPGWVETILSTLYFLSLAFGMWALWRRYSLRTLRWELPIFLAQFLFQAAGSLSSLVLHQQLLTLVALLLLWSNTLLAALLFWKKERLSGSLLFFPVLWNFYLVGLNMVICSKP
jgi:tryptophan-rich sensory protein